MKVEYINPFIESVYNLFTSTLKSEAKRGDVGFEQAGVDKSEIVAIIGIGGGLRGTIAISFPESSALAIVNRFLETDLKEIDATVSDGIAEFVNIVAGGAKAKLCADPPATLSLPTVVRGNNFNVEHPSKAAWLKIPFTSEFGPFVLRVTFDLLKK